MNSINITSITEISNNFLPKIAREYDITREEGNGNTKINNSQSEKHPSLISAGWFSSVFSNNRIDMRSNQESQKKKGKEKESPNYLQLVLVGAGVAITTAFGLGRLHSSIAAADENIWYSRRVKIHPLMWNRTLNVKIIQDILNVTDAYERAEMTRKDKLSNYQNSLVVVALGTGIGIVGALASVELLVAIGIISAVASATFAAYHVAIHWDDFTRAQDELKSFKLLDLIHQLTSPPPAGWNIPPSCPQF